MARIRTIKPEFPQSESMGRVSRDARLLFIMLWTICDDYGRTRAASRMLASVLYPYDEDATSLLDGWLAELDQEGCIRLYEVDGSRYLEVCKWLNHQKVDRPSKSKFPEFDESSRVFASPRESHAKISVGPRTKDQGSRTKEGDQGSGPEDREKDKIPAAPKNGATAPDDPGTDPKPPASTEPTALQQLCRSIWSSYSTAYQARYSTPPVRNAKVNALVQMLAKRIGQEAPEVAAWFVGHNAQWYVTKGHSLESLVGDAEKLRTEWATGKRTTTTQARQADRTASNVFARMLEEEHAKQNS